MTADEILKVTIGDLVFKNALLQARVAELEAKLDKTDNKVGKEQ